MKKEKADPTAPGGEEFDIETASAEDFAKHEELLRRRSVIASLKPAPAVQQVAIVEAPVASAEPYRDPTDIRAVHPTLGERYFTQLTWDAMETSGKHEGWEEFVPKPSDLK